MKKLILGMLMAIMAMSVAHAGSEKFELSEKKVAKLNPQARAYYEQGQEHLDFIRKQEALEMFVKACESDPDHIDLLFLVAKMELSESHRNRDAEYSYITDDKELNEESRLLYNQGLDYLDKSLEEEALSSFKQACRMCPDHKGLQFIISKLEQKDPASRRSMQARRMMDRAQSHTDIIRNKKGKGASIAEIKRAEGNLNIISRDKAQQTERENRRQAAGEIMSKEHWKEINESGKRQAEENQDEDQDEKKKTKKPVGDRQENF